MRTRGTVFHGLCGLLMATLAWAGGGSGTAADPYVITDVHELQAMEADPAAHYVLGNDIDASETALWNGGSGFVPVGSTSDPFTGELDGRGHVIKGLHVDRGTESDVGLIGFAFGASIQGVRIEDGWLRGNYFVGILVGRAVGETLVSRSSVTGTLTLPSGSSDAKSGGLAGGVGRGARVDQCYSDVEVFASNRRQVGGLVGYLRGVETAWPIATITNSYAAGTVHGNGGKQGNLLGDADGSRVDRCYSSGPGKALIGFNFRSPTITNSYWDAERGPATSHRGGSGRSTAQMMSESTFVGWDFDEIWGIDEGESYPYLRFDQALEMASFHLSSVRLVFRGPGGDDLRWGAWFRLDESSDGIEPELEEVRVEAAAFAKVVPAGSFRCRSGVCTYRSDDGVDYLLIREAYESEREIGDYYAWMKAHFVDLAGATNPIELALQIGDDRGQVTVRLEGVLRTR